MYLSNPSTLLTLLSALTPLAQAVAYDCASIVQDGIKFDLKPLAGPRSVSLLDRLGTGAIDNITFTLDICDNLPYEEKTKVHCPMGTRSLSAPVRYCLRSELLTKFSLVCAERRTYKEGSKEEPEPEDIWPVAGEFTAHSGRPLDPKWTRLKTSDSPADSELEGLRLELNGGVGSGQSKTPQKALIQLLCDKDQTGLEGSDKPSRAKRADEGDDGDKGDDLEQPGGPLRVIKYKNVPENDKITAVLHLEWKTKYACEDEAGHETGSSSGSWGFFTWFILM